MTPSEPKETVSNGQFFQSIKQNVPMTDNFVYDQASKSRPQDDQDDQDDHSIGYEVIMTDFESI